MRYLQKVIVEGFQSHLYSELEFIPGLNVIVGPSDQGKSALIRALRWVLYNEPRGADFVRAGASLCRVTITMDDGTIVTRERQAGGGKNRYVLQKPGGKKGIYEGFGSEVPAEIIAATGVARVFWDEGHRVELNLSRQLEGPFLLSENGAVKAKVIGRLGGVHILDAAQREVVADLRRVALVEKNLNEELEVLTAELQKYAHLPYLEEILWKVLLCVKTAEEAVRELEALTEIKDTLASVEAAKARLEEVLASLKFLPRGEELMQEITLLQDQKEVLEALAEEVAAGKAAQEKTTKILAQTEMLPQGKEKLRALENLQGEMRQLAEWKEDLLVIDHGLSLVEKRLAQTEAFEETEQKVTLLSALPRQLWELSTLAFELKETRARWEKASLTAEQAAVTLKGYQAKMRELLVAVGKCPTCLQDLTSEAINLILCEYQ